MHERFRHSCQGCQRELELETPVDGLEAVLAGSDNVLAAPLVAVVEQAPAVPLAGTRVYLASLDCEPLQC